VSVNAVTEAASCPLDGRLFAPERWDDDVERRAACRFQSACGIDPSGSWPWTWWMSFTSGALAAGASLSCP
jgi:hypothetical protein